MKFRILASIAVLAVVAILLFVTQGGSSTPQSSPTTSDLGGDVFNTPSK